MNDIEFKTNPGKRKREREREQPTKSDICNIYGDNFWKLEYALRNF